MVDIDAVATGSPGLRSPGPDASIHDRFPRDADGAALERSHPGRLGWIRRGAWAVEAVALATLVGAAGSPVGRSGRVLVVLLVSAVGCWLGEGRMPTAGAVARVVAGVVGLIAGVAIGVSHVLRAGVAVEAVAGLAALAAGLALLVDGTVALVRSTSGWRRWLAVPIGFVVVQFVVVPGAVAVLVDNPPPSPLTGASPADHGAVFEETTFTASDGVSLAAWWVPSRNGAAIVAVPGSGSNREGVLAQAMVMADQGYGVLVVDPRGHGASEGEAMDFGWFGRTDLAAAVDHVGRRAGVDPQRIGVLGESMGAEQALTAAAFDRRIRAVVAEGTGRRVPGDPGGADGLLEQVVEAEQDALIDLLTDAERPPPLAEAARAAAPTPVLLIAGAGEAEVANAYRDEAPGSVQVWDLPSVPHVGGLAARPEEWRARVTGFFDEALLGDR